MLLGRLKKEEVEKDDVVSSCHANSCGVPIDCRPAGGLGGDGGEGEEAKASIISASAAVAADEDELREVSGRVGKSNRSAPPRLRDSLDELEPAAALPPTIVVELLVELSIAQHCQQGGSGRKAMKGMKSGTRML